MFMLAAPLYGISGRLRKNGRIWNNLLVFEVDMRLSNPFFDVGISENGVLRLFLAVSKRHDIRDFWVPGGRSHQTKSQVYGGRADHNFLCWFLALDHGHDILGSSDSLCSSRSCSFVCYLQRISLTS